MRLLLIGHGEHGKSEVAEQLYRQLGMTYKDSSWAACEKAVYPVLAPRYGYTSLEECYADRRNHRTEWHDLIRAYNNPLTRLADEILAEHPTYVGMRNREEFDACDEVKTFDLVVGVDARGRKPLEPKGSFQLDLDRDPDWLIDNNGSFEHLLAAIQDFIDRFDLRVEDEEARPA